METEICYKCENHSNYKDSFIVTVLGHSWSKYASIVPFIAAKLSKSARGAQISIVRGSIEGKFRCFGGVVWVFLASMLDKKGSILSSAF